MTMTYDQLMEGLSESQRAAATVSENAVIAAGAGSGKTSVLAARYVHLVVHEGIPVDAILALTFTRKAAAEMYSRIHDTLRSIDDPRAREAVANFHRARISTLDSFCASVARNACRAYGVAPDFGTDAAEIARVAGELALPFFLERRKTRAIRRLTRRYRMADLPAGLFAETMIRHSSLATPPDFARFLDDQRRLTRARVDALATEILALAPVMRDTPAQTKTALEIRAATPDGIGAPDPASAGEVDAFCKAFAPLARCAKPRQSSNPDIEELREAFVEFRDRLYPALLATANWVLNEDVIAETLSLLAEFQEAFNRRKREAGLLTFTDVARMAVDALTNDPDLRRAWKDSIRSIMIDEFQDDNDLQRDLLFLIAERPERVDRSVPGPEDLVNGKLFFVGDEKQSIYRFRGADVSVFRKLAGELAIPADASTSAPGSAGSAPAPALATNYRTEAALIDSFNAIFPRVFPASIVDETGERPPYEAEFAPIIPAKRTEGVESAFDILVVSKENFDRDAPGFLSSEDTEAREIAERISSLVRDRVMIADRGSARPCEFRDVAILLRSGTNQRAIERQLRDAGVPYQTENVRGLFDDAPVNDLYALLRLAVYPADTTAYATLLRSPLVGASDEAFARALLARERAEAAGLAIPEPFDDSIDPFLSAVDRERFARARSLYRSVRDDADRAQSAEAVTRLWHHEGYRYALYSDRGLERYAELYDYFFELARQADAEGLSLAGFLDRVATLMDSGERIDSLDVPVEQSGGVTIMTVHKSKGLEFPVVFVADAGSDGTGGRDSSPVYRSELGGVSVNTGASEENEDADENWFYAHDREGETRREIAESRRLLYVAMTRAGSRLVVSGRVSLSREAVAEPREGDALMDAIAEWVEPKNGDEAAPKRQSFLKMLLGAVAREARAGNPVPLVTVTEILPRRREGAGATQGFRNRLTEPETLERYRAIPTAEYRPSPRARYSATELHSLVGAGSRDNAGKGEDAGAAIKEDALDALLRKANVDATEFGTWAHRAIEARLTGIGSWVPEAFRAITDEMAARFLSSSLGRLASRADWLESEFGFIVRDELEGRPITVTGQMDLIFETGGTAYVVDYKTDRVEDPAMHREQLDAYRKAAIELRKKPVETWLFYLRTGTALRIH